MAPPARAFTASSRKSLPRMQGHSATCPLACGVDQALLYGPKAVVAVNAVGRARHVQAGGGPHAQVAFGTGFETLA